MPLALHMHGMHEVYIVHAANIHVGGYNYNYV